MRPEAATALREAREALARGDLDGAISRYRRALRAEDGAADVHRELGVLYHERGWQAEAERCLQDAIARRPEDAAAHKRLAAVYFAQGRLREARLAFGRSLALRARGWLPAFLRWRLSVPLPAAGEAGQPVEMPPQATVVERMLEDGTLTEEALAALSQATVRRPDCAGCHVLLARAHSTLGRVDEAAASAEAALRIDPASAAVLAGVSASLHPWNNQQAERFARKALEIDPASGPAHASLGMALWGLGRLDEAEAHCREALRLDPSRLVNRLNLAVILRQSGRMAEARALYDELDPAQIANARVCADIGNLVLESGGNPEEARRWYRRGQSSDDARSHFLEATLDLSINKFAAGWDRYEARKHTSDRRWHREYGQFPEWDGEPLGERRLLVYGEQGLGDEIMFASMLPDLHKRAKQVTLLCDTRLGTLFARSFPGIEVVPAELERRGERAAALSGIECHIAAGSLGRLFRRRAEDFPRHRGYLVPEPGRMAAWGEKLAGLGRGLRVGLSWRGGVQGTGRSRRSLTLDALSPVLGQTGVSWVSLQHAVDGDEVARYGADHGVRIAHFEGVTQDLDELAALIASLDLVVSVCNTNVHLAGALGKQAWVMSPLVPEWRYGRTGERMHWYPSARVFRQSRYGEWEPVVQRVASGIAARAREQASGAPIVRRDLP